MPKHTGARFEPWSTCERCSFQYPLSQLVSQFGLRVCMKYCVDNTSILYRPFVIEQILSDPNSTEGRPITPEVERNPEEILF